jgi:hypothetical protein
LEGYEVWVRKNPPPGRGPLLKISAGYVEFYGTQLFKGKEPVTLRRKGEVMDFDLIKSPMTARIWIEFLDGIFSVQGLSVRLTVSETYRQRERGITPRTAK